LVHKERQGKQNICVTLKLKDLIDLGGQTLVSHVYKGSLLQLLSATYPDYDWLPWKFDGECPPEFWDSVKNQRKFTDWAAKQLNIKEMSDWYNITFQVTLL
jgi:hypothetical protein